MTPTPVPLSILFTVTNIGKRAIGARDSRPKRGVVHVARGATEEVALVMGEFRSLKRRADAGEISLSVVPNQEAFNGADLTKFDPNRDGWPGGGASDEDAELTAAYEAGVEAGKAGLPAEPPADLVDADIQQAWRDGHGDGGKEDDAALLADAGEEAKALAANADAEASQADAGSGEEDVSAGAMIDFAAMDDDALRAFATARGNKPHHKAGREKLLDAAKSVEGVAPEDKPEADEEREPVG